MKFNLFKNSAGFIQAPLYIRFKNRVGINNVSKGGAGFTLIELLVGVFIITVSATAVIVLLSSSFRISNKTTSMGSVRESGNNAINLMQKTIQFANGFSAASNDSAFTTYVTACPATPTVYNYIRIRTSSGVIQEFSCTPTSPIHLYYDKGSGDTDLIDIDKMNITSCQLTCSQNSSDVAPVIGISFALALKTTSSLSEQNASLSFSTSAKMRNL